MNKMTLIIMLAVIVAAACAEIKALYNKNEGTIGFGGNYVYEGSCLSMVENKPNLIMMFVLLNLMLAAAFVIFR